jgi:hypothetical protein
MRRRISEEDLTMTDAAGRRYPPRKLGVKLTDTVIRSVGVAFLLVAIGLLWEAFH